MTDDFSVTVRREIAAPAEELFDAWLDANSLATWFRPGGTREARVEMDPRVGGTFRIVTVDGDSTMPTPAPIGRLTGPIVSSSPGLRLRRRSGTRS